MRRHPYRTFGLAAAVGFCAACGCLMLNEHTRHRVTKRVRKTVKALMRRQAELRDTASSIFERGEKGVGHVIHKGRRVIHVLAS